MEVVVCTVFFFALKMAQCTTTCVFLCQGAVSERVGARVPRADSLKPETRRELQLQSHCLQ